MRSWWLIRLLAKVYLKPHLEAEAAHVEENQNYCYVRHVEETDKFMTLERIVEK